MKKLFLLLVLLLSAASLSAKDVYDGADAETKKLIGEVDALIYQKQYATAFGRLSDETNEYIIAKRVEVAINYYVQSMMHQMFAFKNLDEDDDIEEVRGETGTYSLIFYNPEDVIKKFVEQNGEKPILDYALGLYYEDVHNRYGEDWLIPEDEIVENTCKYLLKAFEQGYYDSWSLSVLGTALYRHKDYEQAIQVYESKEKEYKMTGTDNYHLGILYWIVDEYQKGLDHVIVSADQYEDIPDYQADAYIVSARIALDMNDYKTTEKYLDLCYSKYPDDYRIYQYRICLYAAQNMNKKVVENGLILFTYGVDNPKTCQLLIEGCNDYNNTTAAFDFFKAAIKQYKKNNAALANLYFHYAYEFYLIDNDAEAAKYAKEARKYFDKSNTMTEEIDGLLKQLCGETTD